MLVFIDESGDPGFKVEQGSSPLFVAAMVIFASGADATAAQQAIGASEARKQHKAEFKFSACRSSVRDLYFECVKDLQFKVRAIVVKKEVIYSPRLKTDTDKFYEFFVSNMMKFDDKILQDARVIIDGSGDRDFKRSLNTAFRRKVTAGAIKDVRFKDSKNDALVQLADMCAGAIARSYRADRKDADRWRRMLRARIDNIWDFK